MVLCRLGDKMAKSNADFGKKYTFYRPDYVINFQAVVSLKGFSTVNVEIAPCVNKAAQWDQKITLQLSEQDLYKYFYTFSHQRLFVYESKYHGTNRKKSIKFIEEEGGCTISVSNEGKVFYFKCSVGEWFYGQLLMLEQLLGHALSLSEARSIILETKSPKAVKTS